MHHVHKYFISHCLKREKVTATKPFEKGYKIFYAGKVQTVVINNSISSLYSVIRAAVVPSQKLKCIYKTAVAINKTSGIVLFGHCTCMAGKSSSCNHVAALLFKLDDHNRTLASKGCGSGLSSTSLPSVWNVPKSGKLPPTPIKKLEVVKPTCRLDREPTTRTRHSQ